MRPIPHAIQRRYPHAGDRLPDRPWWQEGSFGWDTAGHAVYIKPSPYMRSDGKRAQNLDHVAEIDKANPLPHPGFRVGQIWSSPDGAKVIQLYASWLHGDGRKWLPAPAIGATSGPMAYYFDVGDPNDVGIGIDTGLSGYFLLADPACPHLAPWAPAI